MVMSHGTRTEPIAREWYENAYQVKVDELGVVIPKWEIRIGASLDGSIRGTDGMIEIKCPKYMYKPLLARMESGDAITDNFDHISAHHYAQMQGGMEICNKSYCDYIVYSTLNKMVYVERIYRDQKYWNEVLYPGIKNFLENVMEPLLK